MVFLPHVQDFISVYSRADKDLLAKLCTNILCACLQVHSNGIASVLLNELGVANRMYAYNTMASYRKRLAIFTLAAIIYIVYVLYFYIRDSIVVCSYW